MELYKRGSPFCSSHDTIHTLAHGYDAISAFIQLLYRLKFSSKCILVTTYTAVKKRRKKRWKEYKSQMICPSHLPITPCSRNMRWPFFTCWLVLRRGPVAVLDCFTRLLVEVEACWMNNWGSAVRRRTAGRLFWQQRQKENAKHSPTRSK